MCYMSCEVHDFVVGVVWGVGRMADGLKACSGGVGFGVVGCGSAMLGDWGLGGV